MINYCLIKTNNNENVLEKNYTIEKKSLKKLQNFSFKNKSENNSNLLKDNLSKSESMFLNIKNNKKVFRKEYDKIYINERKEFIKNIFDLKKNIFLIYERNIFIKIINDLIKFFDINKLENLKFDLDIYFQNKIYSLFKNKNQRNELKKKYLTKTLKNFENSINSMNYNISIKIFTCTKNELYFNFFCLSNFKKINKNNNLEIKKILEEKVLFKNKKIIFIDFLESSKNDYKILEQIKNFEKKKRFGNILRENLQNENYQKKKSFNFLNKKNLIDSWESINKSLNTKYLSQKKNKEFSSSLEKINYFNSTNKNFKRSKRIKISNKKKDKKKNQKYIEIIEKIKNLEFEKDLLKKDNSKKDSKIKRLEIKNKLINDEKKKTEFKLIEYEKKVDNLKNILKNIGINYTKKIEEKKIQINEFEKRILKIKNSKRKIIKNNKNENSIFVEKINSLEKELKTNKKEKNFFFEKISLKEEEKKKFECYKIIQVLISKKNCENKKIENLKLKNLKLEKKILILRNSLKTSKRNFIEELQKYKSENKNYENSNMFLYEKNINLSKNYLIIKN